MTPGLGFSLPETSTMVRVPKRQWSCPDWEAPERPSRQRPPTAPRPTRARLRSADTPIPSVSLPSPSPVGKDGDRTLESRAVPRCDPALSAESHRSTGSEATLGMGTREPLILRFGALRAHIPSAWPRRSTGASAPSRYGGPRAQRSPAPAATPGGDRIHGVRQEPRARKDGAPTKVRSRGRSTRYNPQPDQPLSGTQRMIAEQISLNLPPPWAGATFEADEVGPINYLVGPNGSGKSRFASELLQHLNNRSSKARLLSTDRLKEMTNPGRLGGYFGDPFEAGIARIALRSASSRGVRRIGNRRGAAARGTNGPSDPD